MAGRYPTAERVVVKVGTGTLFDEAPEAVSGYKFLGDQLQALCYEISGMSREIAVVSSGAIATAACEFGAPVPKSKYEKAQLAGRGQHILMGRYETFLREYGKGCAQCLLTHDDLKDARRRRNLRMVLDGYFRDGIVPIINENDTVSTEEISFGDNDKLAASLAFPACLDADLVVMLSNRVEGLGTGGGASKEEARRMLEQAGISMEIINGRYERDGDAWKPKIWQLFLP